MSLKHKCILVVFAAIFFLTYSYVPLSTPPKFVSPDEVTNYFFTNLYSQTGEISYSEDLNEVAFGIIRPRSTVYVNGQVAPVKFIGFPLIGGTVGAILSEATRFLIPLLAIIGALFLYLLVRDLFNEKVALLSFLLLFILPPYWYWSSLTMFENVAGCAMLIISLRYFFKLLNTNDARHYLLSGLFFGTSLFIRPDYILFTVPLLAFLLWNRRQIKMAYALTVLSFIAALGPFFILNKQLYNSFTFTGSHIRYGISRQIPISSFSMTNLFENSINLIELTPLLFLSGLLGFIYCLKKRVHLQYIIFAVMCLLTLSLYFLSGRVLPSNIHSSYVRYLLPVYLLFLPFISYLILSFKSKFISILLIFAILVTSIYIVVPAIDNNIKHVEGYARLNSQIVDATEPDAIIFLDYWDKAIFPARKVGLVRELPTQNRCTLLCEIVTKLSERNVPVYLLIEKRFKELIDREALVEGISARGYTLTEAGMKSLYRIERLEEG